MPLSSLLMNTKIRPLTFCLFACLAGISFFGNLAHGAVIAVNSGEVLQDAIDSASSGDELVLADGVYNTATITNKSVSLRSISGTAQILSIKFTGVTQGSTVKDIRVTTDFECNQSKVRFYNCEISGDVNATNSVVELIETSVAGDANFTGTSFNGGLSNTLLFRATINQKLTCETAKSNISYCLIRYAKIAGQSEITGNEFKGRALKAIGIDIHGSSTNAIVRNNRIHDFWVSDGGTIENVLIGVRVSENARADILNNLFHNIGDTSGAGTESKIGMGVYVVSTSATKIAGNIFWSIFARDFPNSEIGNTIIHAPNENVTITNNVFWKPDGYTTANFVMGGAVNTDAVIGDPKFTNHVNDDFSLASGSPAIDAGPAGSVYNDRDGSRNDIGMFGGHNFIPDGRTTNKPIVLGLDVAPIAVPTGGTVTIESTGATVK
jgi:hypothetical protein